MDAVGMKNNYQFNSFKDSDILVEVLSGRIETELEDALAQKKRVSIAFSGGSTPKKLLQRLSQADIEWYRVDVLLVDERWVSTASTYSNEHFLREYFFINYAKNAVFIPLKNAIVEPKDAQIVTNYRLEKIKKLDIAILGMGEDGHTASFFPHMKELDFALNTQMYCSSATAKAEPSKRMSLSRSFLLTAKSLILHIEGERKKDVFDKATQSNDVFALPIIAMMQQKEPLLEVYYADK